MTLMRSRSSISSMVAVAAIWSQIECAHAVEIESLGKAPAAILGTTNVFKKSVHVGSKDETVFYSKNGSGPDQIAFVQHEAYEPNCTHTYESTTRKRRTETKQS